MTSTSNFIDFILIADDDEIRIKTYPEEYADLRLLIKEYLNHDDFGQCGGMARCATCLVAISSGVKPVRTFSNPSLNRNNDRMVKLSCQVVINDELANKTVNVLPER